MTETTEIAILDQKIRLLQPVKGFRTSLDSVMLAAACPVINSETVLDLGCGVGGAAFCLRRRAPEAVVTGIDIQERYIELARENKALNGEDRNLSFEVADIRHVKDRYIQSFNHVICNPPFQEAGTHLASPQPDKAIARGHIEPDNAPHLEDWITAGFYALKAKGTLTMIHRADRLHDILYVMGKRFGAVEIIPLWPKAGKAAKRIIVRAVRDSRAPSHLYPGLILHKDDGRYTEEADAVLRGKAEL